MSRTWHYCSHCGHCFENHAGLSGTEIGVPFRKCGKCGGMIRLRHRQEWILMKWWEKTWLFLLATLSALVAGGLLLGLLYWLLTEKLVHRPLSGAEQSLLLVTGGAAMAVLVRCFLRALRNDIAESKARTANPDYLTILHHMGILAAGAAPGGASIQPEAGQFGASGMKTTDLSNILKQAGIE